MVFDHPDRAQDYWPDSLNRALAYATECKDNAKLAANQAVCYFGKTGF